MKQKYGFHVSMLLVVAVAVLFFSHFQQTLSAQLYTATKVVDTYQYDNVERTQRLRLNSTDHPRIVYATTTVPNKLRYGECNVTNCYLASNWTFADIDTAVATGGNEIDYAIGPSDVNWIASAGHAYTCSTSCTTPANWTKVSGAYTTTRRFVSIKVNSSGGPRIASGDFASGLYYSSCDATCTNIANWTTITVLSPDQGAYVNLALTSTGHPRISSTFSNADRTTQYIYCDTACETTPANWTAVGVDPSGDFFTAIALDGSDNPNIITSAGNYDSCTTACGTLGNWSVTAVAGTATGYYHQIFVDGLGRKVIFHSTNTYQICTSGCTTPGNWSSNVLIGYPGNLDQNSVQIDSNNNYRASFDLSTSSGAREIYYLSYADVLAVTSFTPSANALAVSVTSPITVVFDSALNTATVTSSSFRVFSDSGLVPGTFSFINADTTAIFTPSGSYPVGRKVQVVLTTDIQSATGKALASPVTREFTVEVTSGNGTYLTATNVLTSSAGSVDAVAAGDFNNDGNPDIAAGLSNKVEIFLGDGVGGFTSFTTLPSTGFQRDILSRDFDNDGNADLAWPINLGLRVRYGNGNGTFQPAVDYTLTEDPMSVIARDFNGDGLLDIAVSTFDQGFPGNGKLAVLINNGTSFQAPVNTTLIGSGSYALDAADFNVDGILDIAVSVYWVNPGIYIYRGNGDGTFSYAAQLTGATYVNPTGITINDFNGDGFADILHADAGIGNYLIRGNGDFTFQTPTSFGSGRYQNNAADLDHDGDIDAILGDYFNNLVGTYRNNGTGTFGSVENHSVQPLTWQIELGDFNKDGAIDIATSSYGSTSFSVLLSSPSVSNVTSTTTNGTYSVATVIPIQLTFNRSVINVNTGGGTPTLALNSGGTATYVSGSGTDTLTFNYTVGAGQNAADLDFSSINALALNGGTIKDALSNDASLRLMPPGTLGSLGANKNIVIDTTVTVCGNSVIESGEECDDGNVTSGDGCSNICLNELAVTSVTPANAAKNVSLTTTVVIDFNHAVNPATITAASVLLRGNFTGNIASSRALSLGNTRLTITPTNPLKYGETVDVDLASTILTPTGGALPYGFSSKFIALDSDGGGTPTILSGVNTGGSASKTPEELAIGDIDGDGDNDVLTANESAISVFKNNGSGVLTLSSTITAGSSRHLVLGDFDNNGTLDVAFTDYTGTGQVRVFSNDGTGSFTLLSSLLVGDVPWGILTADFNADGCLDLAVGDENNHHLYVLTNNCSGTFTTTFDSGDLGTNLWDGVVGDFWGDGKNDIAFADGSSQVYIFRNTGTTFTLAQTVTGLSGTQYLTTGDIDGDGDLDLAGGGSSSFSLITNSGGTFSLGTNYPEPSQVRNIRLADLNGDGNLDIALSVFDPSVKILSNNGSGVFTQQYSLTNGEFSIPDGLGIADLNGDGRLDLVTAARFTEKVIVMLNTAPGVASAVTNVTSSHANGSFTIGEVIDIQVTFDQTETVTGTPTLALNSGGTASYLSGSGSTTLTFRYTVAASQNSADLDYTSTSALALSGGTIKNGSVDATLTLPTPGAAGSLGFNKAIIIDTVVPTVSMSSVAGNPTNSNPIPVSVTFSEDVTGFIDTDITTGNATVSNFATVDPAHYTFDLVPAGQGIVTADIDVNKAQDTAGNGNTAATQFSRTFDSVSPTITLASTAPSSTNTAPIPVTVVTSEPTTDFDSTDVTPGNATVSNFAGSGASYSFDLNPSGQGAVTAQVAAGAFHDSANNPNTISNLLSRTYDTVAPTVVISSAAPDPTNTSPIPMTATFSEPVTGFILTDIQTTNGTASNLAGGPAVYTFDVTPSANITDVSANLLAAAAQDAANNDSSVSNTFTIHYDSVAPTESITTTSSDPTNAPIPLSITFTQDVTGFIITDITPSNGSLSNFVTVDPSHYTVLLTASSDGLTGVSIAAAVCKDAANNDNQASSPFSITFDSTAPTVSAVNTTKPDGSYSTGTVIDFTVQYTESVIVNTVGGTPTLALNSGGSAGYLSGSGSNTLTFRYTVSAGNSSNDLDYSATSSLTLNGGTIKDSATNDADNTLPAVGTFAAGHAIVIDTASPTVTDVNSTTFDGAYAASSLITITVTFSEPVFVSSGTPTLALNSGATVSLSGGSGTDTLTFDYTVAGGENSADLDYVATTSLVLNGATIADLAGNSADLILATPGAAGSLGDNRDLVIDTTAPTVIVSSSSGGIVTSSFTADIDFSEGVSPFAIGDITVSNATLSNFIPVSASSFSVDVAPIAFGSVTVEVLGSATFDIAGNPNDPSNVLTRDYQAVPLQGGRSQSSKDLLNTANGGGGTTTSLAESQTLPGTSAGGGHAAAGQGVTPLTPTMINSALAKIAGLQELMGELLSPEDLQLLPKAARMQRILQGVLIQKKTFAILAEVIGKGLYQSFSYPDQEPMRDISELAKSTVISFPYCFSQNLLTRMVSHDRADNPADWAIGYIFGLRTRLEAYFGADLIPWMPIGKLNSFQFLTDFFTQDCGKL